MNLFRKKKRIEFSMIELVRASSPDNSKIININEEYVDGVYSNTSALLEWNAEGGAGILNFVKKGSLVSVMWIDNNTIEIKHDEDLKFRKKEIESFYKGDLVKINYKT